ncbi:MAG TPA: cation-translocating P-type ATPase C-terminal domain-containing protein, partial [Phototrophicaceae bacterium]|nr:cation-translocating P-type ATPase C-terminal domain-containing protein [Phototrophicaceae bacterium]
ILWINLVTDGLPAIAVGFEPAEAGVMKRKPRPITESIFAGGMDKHIAWVSVLLTTITLGAYIFGYASHGMDPFSPTLALEYRTADQLHETVGAEDVPENWDALSLAERTEIILAHENDEASEEEVSGGLIGEAEQIPRTLAFTVLALGQIFHIMAIHGGDRDSFFRIWFRKNYILLGAVISTFLLQLAVVYLPFLQTTFETEALALAEFLMAVALASTILFAVEIEKFLRRQRDRQTVTVANV